tara:strand:+ start:463 stop:714 length:252 start_codon:yes stop_codon:yes gene_type:complete
MRPARTLHDLVTVLTFKGRKTGKLITKRCASTPNHTIEKAQLSALKLYYLVDDPDRLVSIETKTRKQWMEEGYKPQTPQDLRG